MVHWDEVLFSHGVSHVQGDPGDKSSIVEQVSVEATILSQTLLVVGAACLLPLCPHCFQWDAGWGGTGWFGYSGGGYTWGPSSGRLTCAESGSPFFFLIGSKLLDKVFPLQELLGPTDSGSGQPNVNSVFEI